MTTNFRVVLFIAAAFVVYGQTKKSTQLSATPNMPVASAFLSPIPLYPSNGVVPDELSNNYLFLDGTTHDLVISYPPGLATGAAQSPGPRTEIRIEMKTHVNPLVYVSFAKAPSAAQTTYAYTVVNQPAATRDIASWSLPIPLPGSNLPQTAVDLGLVGQNTPIAAGPAGWATAMSPPDKGLVSVTWSKTGAIGIAPNATLTGASVSSPLTPGFVHLSVTGSTTGTSVAQLALPSAVSQALADLEATNFNQVTVLSLGPKFPAGTNKVAIAANFLEGISVLAKHNYLNSASLFVKEATAALTAFLQGAQFGADGPASEYVGSSLVLTQQPAAGLEAQISQAWLLSLGN